MKGLIAVGACLALAILSYNLLSVEEEERKPETIKTQENTSKNNNKNIKEGYVFEYAGDIPEKITEDMPRELKSNDGNTFLFNSQGDLIRRSQPDGTVEFYSYTPSGERFTKKVSKLN